jgi:hypothetical protein
VAAPVAPAPVPAPAAPVLTKKTTTTSTSTTTTTTTTTLQTETEDSVVGESELITYALAAADRRKERRVRRTGRRSARKDKAATRRLAAASASNQLSVEANAELQGRVEDMQKRVLQSSLRASRSKKFLAENEAAVRAAEQEVRRLHGEKDEVLVTAQAWAKKVAAAELAEAAEAQLQSKFRAGEAKADALAKAVAELDEVGALRRNVCEVLAVGTVSVSNQQQQQQQQQQQLQLQPQP